MKSDVAILGAGPFALTVAQMLRRAGRQVCLWARREEARQKAQAHIDGLEIVDSIALAGEAPVVIFATPASATRSIAAKLGEVAQPDQIVLHAIRGLCPGNRLLLAHDVIRSETCIRKIGALGGPLYEVAPGDDRPMATVVASRFDEVPKRVRALTAATAVRVDATDDIVGVEIAGAVSAVSAIAVGMSDALGLGETVRGVLLTHGLSEAARFGVALGADASTFWGLAGVGDLIPREVVSTAAGQRVGAALAQGVPLSDAMQQQSTEIEGIHSASVFATESIRRRIELPLLTTVDDICKGRITASEGIHRVLQRHLDLGHVAHR